MAGRYLGILFVLLTYGAFGQTIDQTNQNNNSNKVIFLLDSLKQKIFKDTLKFSTTDLIHRISGTTNKNAYSALFIINGRYYYKLDIIPAENVLEFVEEYFQPSKVKEISILNKDKGASLFGIHGQQGVVVIKLKKGIQFNPEVGKLKRTKKQSGDNYQQGGTEYIYQHSMN